MFNVQYHVSYIRAKYPTNDDVEWKYLSTNKWNSEIVSNVGIDGMMVQCFCFVRITWQLLTAINCFNHDNKYTTMAIHSFIIYLSYFRKKRNCIIDIEYSIFCSMFIFVMWWHWMISNFALNFNWIIKYHVAFLEY